MDLLDIKINEKNRTFSVLRSIVTPLISTMILLDRPPQHSPCRLIALYISMILSSATRDHHGGDRMVVGFTTTCAITTEVVSSNHIHGEVYSIQHYVIKFVSDLRQVGAFSPGTAVSYTNKTDHHDITEILLKVAP